MDQRAEDARRQFEIDARNAHQLKQWLGASDMLDFDRFRGGDGKMPDIRTYDLQERGRLLAVKRIAMRRWMATRDSRMRDTINAKLERGACLGIGDAPGSARVLAIDDMPRIADMYSFPA